MASIRKLSAGPLASLGIHLGHNASCAAVISGKLEAAIQLERTSRVKHASVHHLSNALPVEDVLSVARLKIKDLHHIVSSFQAASPGGLGFGDRLCDDDFNIFDVNDDRHIVISHHLAHAMSAVGLSGFDEATVLVCDLAGSTTLNGSDFAIPYTEWAKTISSPALTAKVLTECMSVYHWKQGKITLVDREYVVPHNRPESFMFSEASLYENATLAVFDGRPAYGELMALSAYAEGDRNQYNLEDIVVFRNGRIHWKNDWQPSRDPRPFSLSTASQIAYETQNALNEALVYRAQQAVKMTGCRNLAVGGGVFLNIIANSKILSSGVVDRLYVPSCPHDAGISAGCAFYGQTIYGERSFQTILDDRVGSEFSPRQIAEALNECAMLVEFDQAKSIQIAEHLVDGAIVARFSGKAEFGPRALGARSLLATPILKESKVKLNTIKGRQYWRPVAPITNDKFMDIYFEGPPVSPFMNYVHTIKTEFIDVFKALEHPDHSTRAQSLTKRCDECLYEIIDHFHHLTGYGLLVNTSLNGNNEPIVETPSEAISFFLSQPLIDYLLIGDQIIERRKPWSSKRLLKSRLTLSPNVYLHQIQGKSGSAIRIWSQGVEVDVLPETFLALSDIDSYPDATTIVESLGGWDTDPALQLYDLLLTEAITTAAP